MNGTTTSQPSKPARRRAVMWLRIVDRVREAKLSLATETRLLSDLYDLVFPELPRRP